MGRFGAAAILAALCSALCLPGSGGKRRRIQYAARNKLNDTFGPRTMGSWLFFLLGVRGEDLGIADLSGCRRSGRRSFSSSHNDSDSIAVCVNQLVKTFCRELCSTWAWSRISRHIRAPLSLHYLCDSGRAAVRSCWDGQPGSARTLGELPLQHSCITGGHRSRGKSTPNP